MEEQVSTDVVLDVFCNTLPDSLTHFSFCLICPFGMKQVRQAFEHNNVLQQQNQELQSRLAEAERNVIGLHEEAARKASELRSELEQKVAEGQHNMFRMFTERMSEEISQLTLSRNANDRNENKELLEALRGRRSQGTAPTPAPANYGFTQPPDPTPNLADFDVTQRSAPTPAPANYGFTQPPAQTLVNLDFTQPPAPTPALADLNFTQPPAPTPDLADFNAPAGAAEDFSLSPTADEIRAHEQLAFQHMAPSDDAKPPADSSNFNRVVPGPNMTATGYQASAAPVAVDARTMPPPTNQPMGADTLADSAATATDADGSLASDGIMDVTPKPRRSARSKKSSSKASAEVGSNQSVVSSRSRSSKSKRSATKPSSASTRSNQRRSEAHKSPHGTLPPNSTNEGINYYNNNNNNNNNIIEDDDDL